MRAKFSIRGSEGPARRLAGRPKATSGRVLAVLLLLSTAAPAQVKINITEPLDFGQVRVGSKASREIVLTCERQPAAGGCRITDLQVRAAQGNQGRDFLLISGAPTNSTTLVIPQGGTRKITLVFAPTRKGASQVTVALRDNGQWREFKVTAKAI